jgi:hypothetical protein
VKYPKSSSVAHQWVKLTRTDYIQFLRSVCANEQWLLYFCNTESAWKAMVPGGVDYSFCNWVCSEAFPPMHTSDTTVLVYSRRSADPDADVPLSRPAVRRNRTVHNIPRCPSRRTELLKKKIRQSL